MKKTYCLAAIMALAAAIRSLSGAEGHGEANASTLGFGAASTTSQMA